MEEGREEGRGTNVISQFFKLNNNFARSVIRVNIPLILFNITTFSSIKHVVR